MVEKVFEHYANIPMHYAEILKGVKMLIINKKKLMVFSFFAQNIDRCYTLEPPQ